jgi:hypothetical protein
MRTLGEESPAQRTLGIRWHTSALTHGGSDAYYALISMYVSLELP